MSKLSQLRDRLERGERDIRRVDLSNERLTDFPHELFQITQSLEFLNLGNNDLTTLPLNIHEFTSLKILFFAQNCFSKFPIQLKALSNLYMLSFKSNQLEEIPEDSLPSSLTWLILTDNKLKALPRSIGDLTKLRKVMLSGNQLEYLPQEMSKCRDIELIRLSVNRLQELPYWLTELPRLAWIAYSGNPFNGKFDALANHVPSKVVDWSEIQIINQLGEGASGNVFKASFANFEVAAKVYKGDITSDGVAEDEIKINEAIGQHASFVPIIGRISNHPQQKPGLLLQLLPEGEYSGLGGPPSFDSVTRDVFPDSLQLSPHYVLNVIRSIACGGQHLHSRGIAHGDLYAHNILVAKDGRALLTDFGASSFTSLHGEATANRLEKIEVRAFGNLVDDLLQRTLVGDEECGLIISTLIDLRKQCLVDDIMARPSFSQIVHQLSEI